MDWYIPLIALPGQALLVLSTSNFILHLYEEIRRIKVDREKGNFILVKTHQIRTLNLGLILQYIAILMFVSAAIIGNIEFSMLADVILLTGLICFLVAISLLIKFSIKAYRIRIKYLKSL